MICPTTTFNGQAKAVTLVAIRAAWLTARFVTDWLPKQPARRRLAADVERYISGSC
jgi:hypothetical protein